MGWGGAFVTFHLPENVSRNTRRDKIHLGSLLIYWRITLSWVLNTDGMRAWVWLLWLRTGPSARKCPQPRQRKGSASYFVNSFVGEWDRIMTGVLETLRTTKQCRPVQKRFKILSQNRSHPLTNIVTTFLSTAISHMRNILCRRMSINVYYSEIL